MKVFPPSLAGLILILLLNSSWWQMAQAQTDDVALAKLHQARGLLDIAVSTSAEKLPQIDYSRVKQAAVLFEQCAPKFIVDDAYRFEIQSFPSSVQASLPSLMSIVEYCDEARSAECKQIMGDLSSFILSAILQLEAERDYPVPADPQFYESLTPPKDGIDLLRNFRFLLDQNALGRPDFYRADIISRAFGTAPQAIYRSGQGYRATWFAKPAPAHLAQSCSYQIEGRGRRAGASNVLPFGSVQLGCSLPRAMPTLSDVEKVFGTTWSTTVKSPMALPPTSRRQPDAHVPIAYETVSSSDGRRILKTLYVAFDGNGQASHFFLGLMEVN